MTITEHNCEEYFLLYVDNELNNAERNAVEAFVQQHPQYKSVLEGWLQTKLSANNSDVFINKNALFKNEEKEIGIDNYEDYFLLYTDDELSKQEKESTERFVLQHPQLQTEFTLLQQTKLPLEHIVFTGKETLYKKERRVVLLYATKLAVAASFMGLMAIALWLFVFSQHQNTVAVATPVDQKHEVVKPAQIIVQPKVTTSHLQPIIAQKTEQNKSKQPLIPTTKANDKKKAENEVAVNNAKDELPTVKEATTSSETTHTILQQQPVAVANKTAATLKPLEEVNTDETNAQTALLVASDDNMAKPAVYKELNTDEDNHTLYVGSLQLNKAKVNGILKSASRLLGGRARQNAE